MARSIWSGVLSFGLVSIPISLYPATQEHQLRFHQLEQGTASRVRYRRVNQDTGEEVPYDQIVKGIDTGDGQYIVLTDQELESVEPGGAHTIEISDFVDASEIDPIYYQKTYYLGPRDDAARKPYGLLLRAIEDAGRIAVASFVLRSKQHLAAIRPHDGVLMLETMHFADEVRQPDGIVDRPDTASLRKRDLDMARQLIETMSTSWQPEQYRDSYNDKVRELVEAKRHDEAFPVEEGEREAEVVDLTRALQESINQSRHSGSGQPEAAGAQDSNSSSTDHNVDPSRMSKTQLYEIAQRIGVPGRSQMNRSALEHAVADAAGPEERKAS